jgi:hypothetical protein
VEVTAKCPGEKLPYRNVGRLKAQTPEIPIKLCPEFMSLKAFSWQKFIPTNIHKEQSWNTALHNKE